ncbi:MAG: hypothetical protein C0613_16220 [Desulfobulbaceae bacterium]|nr:MAG: hypothetical protein C0613_16220 [Desulfobulbaceae bacterium]
MVKGLDRFKEHFHDFTDQYILIGGVACYLAMDEAGLAFRATQDLDIVLCVEALDRNFVEAFWDFIQEGDYQVRQKSTGEKQFYRFDKPGKADFPIMLELFSRVPDVLSTREGVHLSPIPVEEEAASLSAILLDEDYYNWIQRGRMMLNGVPIAMPEHIIPLKARAWLDLSASKSAGEKISSKDIKKHKNDVFRLFTVISPDPIDAVPESIKHDLRQFVAAMEDEAIDLPALGLRNITKEDVLENLTAIYAL